MEGYVLTALEDVADFLSGGTPSKATSRFWDGNIPWVSAKDMKSIFVTDTEDHITPEAAAAGSKVVPAGAVLILVRGMTLLSNVPICYANKTVAFNQDIKALVPRSGVDPHYLLYALLATKPQLLDRVDQAGHGTGRLPTDLLKSTKIPLPDLADQRRIAHILGALDDKIELNRRMNATLEAMVQALFKSWFVDFDPVRAKMEGREPAGMDAETAALFPDAFEVMGGREVPVGWEVKSLDEIATYLNGLALQKYPPEREEYLPVIKIAQLKKGNVEGADRASPDIDPAYIINDGDVIFSWSGSLAVVLWCGGQGALNQHLFKVMSDSYPRWFYYLWTVHHLPGFQAIAAGKATTMGHIQRHHLSDAKVLVPSSEQMTIISQTFTPLIDRIVANNMQSRTLAALRDTLLPKLISGEIRVPVEEGPRKERATV